MKTYPEEVGICCMPSGRYYAWSRGLEVSGPPFSFVGPWRATEDEAKNDLRK